MSPLARGTAAADQTEALMFRYVIRYLPVILPVVVRFLRNRRAAGTTGATGPASSTRRP